MAPFEDGKILEYLRNIINSRFINYFSHYILTFSFDVLGEREVYKIIRDDYPEIPKDSSDLYKWRNELSCREVVKILRMKILPEIYYRLEILSFYKDDDLLKRLCELQKAFKLTDAEIDILVMIYLISAHEKLESFFSRNVGFFNILEHSNLRKFGNIIMGLNRKTFISALSRQMLFNIPLVEKSRRIIELTDWCRDYITGFSGNEITSEFFVKDNDIDLNINDFDISGDELDVIDTLIKGKKSCNILFYGAAGTGKTSLTKCLAKRHNMEMFSVNIPKDDDHQDRLRAIYATINLTDKNNSLILADEADEILNTCDSFFFKGKTNKSWINNLLESHDKKIIWITNRAEQIDPSTTRRFSFSMEFKKFTSNGRLNVLKYELKKKGFKNYFDDKELQELCKEYSVDGGGIVNAINIFNLNRRRKKENIIKMVKTVLKNHEKATHAERGDLIQKKEFKDYSLQGLNTSHNLEEIITALKRYTRLQEKGDKYSISLLLYGLPGTGKTEFVHYIGSIMERDVVLKRCSEIQSKWVGETEKNIAWAFQEAKENNGILFFDEADSFLYPRSSAHHSWEKSFTNEILAQLDNFKGIVIFATNDIDGLDHAALRRFRFKIEFRPLTPEGNLHFYKALLEPLVSKRIQLSAEEIGQIKNSRNLTPGDFAVVKEQFSLIDPTAITHQKLIDALLKEVCFKKAERKVIGFGH